MWLCVWLLHTLHSGLQKPRERSQPGATFQNLLHPPTDLPIPCPVSESCCQVLPPDAWLLEGRCSFYLTMQTCFVVGRAVLSSSQLHPGITWRVQKLPASAKEHQCISTAKPPHARLGSLQLPRPPGFSSFQELYDPGSSLKVGYALT
uniref:Uncharacterized protein n=1 Tax=Colobus angolensis palliatus TaxID=336983 RepID=A0A2K5K2P3_COLAP